MPGSLPVESSVHALSLHPSAPMNPPLETHPMIDLTRLNGHRLVVNCDLLKFVEATPDTTLTLVTGEKLIVRESCDQLIALAAQWRSHILTTAWPDAAHAFAAKPSFDTAHPVGLHQPGHGTEHSS